MRTLALVVRDRAWRTLAPDPGSVRTRAYAGGRLRIEARTHVGRAALAWRLDIAPTLDGLDVSATMIADGDVVTNRAGLVVLLPTSVFAGAYCALRHASGAESRSRLPDAIAPHQPLVDLAAVRLAARDGTTLSLAFRGDVFELEDQRNWLDPTFKLYSRALARPIPYRIRDGARIEQGVSMRLERAATRRRTSRRVSERGRVPRIGVATAPLRVPRQPDDLDAVGLLAPAFILHRTDARGRGVAAAAALAESLDCALHLECFGASAALERAVASARPAAVAHYFATAAAKRALLRCAPESARVGGTFSDFVMLNRHGVGADAERVTFALCPTVHARDDRTLVESLDALPQVFAQAMHIAAGRPLDAGPCSLLRRLVPRSGMPADRPRSREGVPYDVDARQHEPIAAAWLTCVIALAAVSRVASVCAFEASGARGLIVASRRPFAHAALAAFAGARGRVLRLYGIDAGIGAAFTLGDELWLVDLSGRTRAMPAGLGLVRRIVRGRRGCTWSPPKRATSLGPYGIARCSSSDRASAIAWCHAPESLK